MRICIFEDEFYRQLQPLVHMRPVFDLRCGQLTLREKVARVYPDEIFILHSRDCLRDSVKERHPGSFVNEIPADADRVLLINGRILFGSKAAAAFEENREDIVYTDSGVILGAWLSGTNLRKYRDSIGKAVVSSTDFDGIRRVEIHGLDVVRFPWDLIDRNGAQLISDFALSTTGQTEILGKLYEGVHLLNASQVHVGKGARIKPGAVLDAERGPVYIGRDVEIMPNAVIRGPAFIGEGSVIRAGAKIYENTSIGEGCKVGGEVEGSIIHAYSNKQHEGFVGHSYLCEWVNIGADSNTSDLKNNYGTVKVYNDGRVVDSGLRFVGLMMGDHSKCGINFMFNTGTVVGAFCNLYGTGVPPKYVPSFSWGESAEEYTTYRLEKALEVARVVMSRRNRTLTGSEEELIKKVFTITGQEREVAGIGS